MIFKSSILFITIFIFLGSSCEKDELTKPAEVRFIFNLGRESQENGLSYFSDGGLAIKSIFLSGDRAKGEDISFTSAFETTINADLSSGITTPPIIFDLPQGRYRKIELVITTDSPIIIDGVHRKQSPLAPTTPIRLEIEIPELRLFVEPQDGVSEISLSRHTGATIEVHLNPADWFEIITFTILDNAEVQDIRGIPSIIISQNSNPEVYRSLISKIPSAIEAIIK